MSFKVWINGKLYDKEDAKVSVYDHGLLYGDGVFEGMRSYQGKVFRCHITWIGSGSRRGPSGSRSPSRRADLAAAVNETLKLNGIRDGYVRLVVTRGAGTLGLDPQRTANPQVIIITDHIALYPQEFYEQGMEIVTASTIRNHPQALSARIKSLNYLNNILAKIEAVRAGCIEAMMLNHQGLVSECTADNIFIVARRKLLRTPPRDAGILAGVTREAVMELAAIGEAFRWKRASLTRHDVYVADECFMTGHGGRDRAGRKGGQPPDRRRRPGSDHAPADDSISRSGSVGVNARTNRFGHPERVGLVDLFSKPIFFSGSVTAILFP